MSAITYYIRNRFHSGRILDHYILKNPVILYPLALILSVYFLLFGWEKTSRID